MAGRLLILQKTINRLVQGGGRRTLWNTKKYAL